MEDKTLRGAQRIIDRWICALEDDRICIVTSDQHHHEAVLMEQCAEARGAQVTLMVLHQDGIYVGNYFDERPDIFAPYDCIIGASDYSIITTKAIRKAIRDGKNFLSLPLSTNNGESMLSFDFIMEEPWSVVKRARPAMRRMRKARHVHITTRLGTDLTFDMTGRTPLLFSGNFWPGHHSTSASFEISTPIIEDATNGVMVVDASFGYIGKPAQPVKVVFEHGRITAIEDNPEGRRLKEYFDSYHDREMFVAAELGIGLNRLSRAAGECYIEDESTYGTFHIGVGRNNGLGGQHHASGHFDIVAWKPTITVDGRPVEVAGVIVP